MTDSTGTVDAAKLYIAACTHAYIYTETDDRLGILMSTSARKIWPQHIICAAVSIMFVLQQRSGVNSVSIV